MVEEKNIKGVKPAFDGRLNYLEVLEKAMNSIIILSYSKDHLAWVRALRSIYSLVSPFWFSQTEKDEVKAELQKIHKDILTCCSGRNNNRVINDHIDYQLFNIQDKLFNSSRHLLLPTKEEDDGDLDMEQWAREVDLA